MRPPPTRIGNGGRYFRTNASMGPESRSSDTPAISKSLRSNSRYSSAMCGNSSRQGSHHDAQKFTSVTLPRNAASLTVSPARSEERRVGKECRSRRGPKHEEERGRDEKGRVGE